MDRTRRPARSFFLEGVELTAWLLVALLALAAGRAVAAEDRAATVTALQGSAALSNGAEMAQRSAVGLDDGFETGEGSRASILVEGDVVVDVCADTRLRLTKPGASGPNALAVDSGEVVTYARPRPADQRLEIHTPTAIATLMGTIVHVNVDEQTGATRIASRDNPVRVASSDPAVAGEVTICCGQEVEIERGSAPSEPRQLERGELEQRGACAGGTHGDAVATDRVNRERHSLDGLAKADRLEVETPPVGAGPDPAPCFAGGCDGVPEIAAEPAPEPEVEPEPEVDQTPPPGTPTSTGTVGLGRTSP
jgi:hypothetical protein